MGSVHCESDATIDFTEGKYWMIVADVDCTWSGVCTP